MRITDAARCLETPATPDGTCHRESTLLRAVNVCIFVLGGLSWRLSRWLCHHLFRGGRLLRICGLLCLHVLFRCGRRLLERRISRLGALTTVATKVTRRLMFVLRLLSSTLHLESRCQGEGLLLSTLKPRIDVFHSSMLVNGGSM